jgi:ABC-type uncharacterized transport system permease subunit
MPVLWLRVAVLFYAVGLLYALLAVTRGHEFLRKIALPAMSLGMVFQFVALAEEGLLSPQLLTASIQNSESLLALVIMAVFMIAYAFYRTLSPGIVAFPIVFLLTFVASSGQQPFLGASEGVRRGWLGAHIGFIFIGYAALFLSFGASILYLLQERNLKAKNGLGILTNLPSLGVIDELGYRSLLLGFPFMTLGLIAGSVVAQASVGPTYFKDSKVLLSVLMWVVYLVLVYTRWNAGWRGRRAAYLAAAAFVVAVIAWVANYFSAVHGFVQS